MRDKTAIEVGAKRKESQMHSFQVTHSNIPTMHVTTFNKVSSSKFKLIFFDKIGLMWEGNFVNNVKIFDNVEDMKNWWVI
jgi:hypothetical protein